ncbi:MAG: hypothetical protein LBT16_04405, partial [Treponema sp.]|nr:hypothetical protein [Treponema sp.]
VSDHFGNIWQLLSETNLFISRIGELPQYQNQLQTMRTGLQRAKANKDRISEIRSQLIELRKNLRLLGYDLSIAKHTLIFDGFRHDDSIAQGFRRLVLFIGDQNLYWMTGDDNHVTLASFLDQKLDNTIRRGERIKIYERHYLWYLRRKTELILSGSATETKDDYERLKAIGEVQALLLLSKLKGLQ